MTVADILEQAKALSSHERKELVKLLVDTLDTAPPITPQLHRLTNDEHWGQGLVHRLQQTESADWGDPHIPDPVEALQAARRQEQTRLDPYWNEEQ